MLDHICTDTQTDRQSRFTIARIEIQGPRHYHSNITVCKISKRFYSCDGKVVKLWMVKLGPLIGCFCRGFMVNEKSMRCYLFIKSPIQWSEWLEFHCCVKCSVAATTTGNSPLKHTTPCGHTFIYFSISFCLVFVCTVPIAIAMTDAIGRQTQTKYALDSFFLLSSTHCVHTSNAMQCNIQLRILRYAHHFVVCFNRHICGAMLNCHRSLKPLSQPFSERNNMLSYWSIVLILPTTFNCTFAVNPLRCYFDSSIYNIDKTVCRNKKVLNLHQSQSTFWTCYMFDACVCVCLPVK